MKPEMVWRYTTATVYQNVEKEVVLKPATLEHEALVPDIKARGVWQAQTNTMFDIAAITDPPSYLATDPYKVTRHATEKKKKYHEACTEKRVSFTPLVLSVDGVPEKDAKHFLSHTAHRLKEKRKCSYAAAINWLRTRISLVRISLVRISLVLIRARVRRSTNDKNKMENAKRDGE
eukprot:GHVR01140248.1.p1 GENE.GHVR01140248.1~~GHVR01140248.1.p1  ORF type:complete len:176 (-),score=17.44 GHVR01140248.1:150-677(-)